MPLRLSLSALVAVASMCGLAAATGSVLAGRHLAGRGRAPVAVAGSQVAARGAPGPAASDPGLGPDLGLAARAAVPVDLDTDRVLWARGAQAERAPASLTKMVTVMVALDHAGLSRTVIVPAGAVRLDPTGDTLMGLRAGEAWTVRELLYGIFLASGNDAAETLAQALMPRDRFIAAMNAKAAQMGLTETHFTNPTGLDQPGLYSSAGDLAVTAAWLASHYPVAVAIAAQPRVSLHATPGHPEIDLVNLNKLVTWPYPGVSGLKTGQTDAAGGCVAATAERAGHHLLAVVLGSPVMFTDAAKLFDYGFSRGPGRPTGFDLEGG